MPDIIHLLNGTTINRDNALENDGNVLTLHTQFQSLLQMYEQLWENKLAVSALVAAYIGIKHEDIELAPFTTWKRGSFNLAVPIMIKQGNDPNQNEQIPDKVLLRIPIPAKVGEEYHPGSVADKLRCEVASYIWMQRHCPEVRIPDLYGFCIPGTNGGQVRISI